jgi:hypothetical protein
LSLRTRSSSRMIDSPQNALHRQSSIGSLRRKASRRSTVTTTLPKFGFEESSEDGVVESFGKELGVSGSTLGLENLVGLPKLRGSEVDVIYAVAFSVEEVKECWDIFGKALRDTGKLGRADHRDPKLNTRMRYRRPHASTTYRSGPFDGTSAARSLSPSSPAISRLLIPVHIRLRSITDPKAPLFRLITERP